MGLALFQWAATGLVVALGRRSLERKRHGT
jgi:hypothetical protein